MIFREVGHPEVPSENMWKSPMPVHLCKGALLTLTIVLQVAREKHWDPRRSQRHNVVLQQQSTTEEDWQTLENYCLS